MRKEKRVRVEKTAEEAKAPRVYRDCQYFLSYGNRQFCRFVWKSDVGSDMMDLSLGCLPNCPDYMPCPWKNNLEDDFEEAP